MSRLTRLSSQAIRAMYGSETDQALIMLLTVYDPVNNTAIVGRMADSFTGRLPALTTDEEIVYGVTSRSNDFYFLPMEITLPGEQETGAGQCSITLNYASPDLIAAIRTTLTKPTKILLELVLSGSPDTVEASFSDFYITSVNYDAQKISLSLDMISLSREPFPCFNFTPGYFPGLF
jgi:hypothetical protein